MKYLGFFTTIVAIAAVGGLAAPVSANNWQWELDRIKAHHQKNAKYDVGRSSRWRNEKRQGTDQRRDQQSTVQPTSQSTPK